MRGNDIAIGYNFALSYKPFEELTLATTYRSKVDLEEKGDASLSATAASIPGTISYNGSASVTVPLPAVWSLAAAYTFNQATTVELEYERVYWGDYKELDFDYGDPIDPRLDALWGTTKIRNWEDSNTYRIGLTHKYNEKWTAMAGYAYDETGAPTDTIGFELPDSNAHIFSLGARYNYNKDLAVGIAGLYDKKDSVTVNQPTALQGTFTDSSAYLLTVGVSYKY